MRPTKTNPPPPDDGIRHRRPHPQQGARCALGGGPDLDPRPALETA
jgi:hypothetical protein